MAGARDIYTRLQAARVLHIVLQYSPTHSACTVVAGYSKGRKSGRSPLPFLGVDRGRPAVRRVPPPVLSARRSVILQVGGLLSSSIDGNATAHRLFPFLLFAASLLCGRVGARTWWVASIATPVSRVSPTRGCLQKKKIALTSRRRRRYPQRTVNSELRRASPPSRLHLQVSGETPTRNRFRGALPLNVEHDDRGRPSHDDDKEQRVGGDIDEDCCDGVRVTRGEPAGTHGRGDPGPEDADEKHFGGDSGATPTQGVEHRFDAADESRQPAEAALSPELEGTPIDSDFRGETTASENYDGEGEGKGENAAAVTSATAVTIESVDRGEEGEEGSSVDRGQRGSHDDEEKFKATRKQCLSSSSIDGGGGGRGGDRTSWENEKQGVFVDGGVDYGVGGHGEEGAGGRRLRSDDHVDDDRVDDDHVDDSSHGSQLTLGRPQPTSVHWKYSRRLLQT